MTLSGWRKILVRNFKSTGENSFLHMKLEFLTTFISYMNSLVGNLYAYDSILNKKPQMLGSITHLWSSISTNFFYYRELQC